MDHKLKHGSMYPYLRAMKVYLTQWTTSFQTKYLGEMWFCYLLAPTLSMVSTKKLAHIT
jgi:hypothetical protein